MAFPVINVNTPSGESQKQFGDDIIREFKGQVVSILSKLSGYPNLEAPKIPTWETAERPAVGLSANVFGFNTTDNKLEYWDEEWKPMTPDIPTIPPRIPIKGIIMWGGSAAEIATIKQEYGVFHLCDGTTHNGVTTPDLRDKFILAAGGSYDVGATGGEKEHTLTINEMPPHSHEIHPSGDGSGPSASRIRGEWTDRPPETRFTDEAGGGLAHNNMPPYYAICYIMRTA